MDGKNGNDDSELLEIMHQLPGYHSWPGEKKLAFAVLKDALQTYQMYALLSNRKGWGVFRETEMWIWSDDQESSFSFLNVCDLFGFNPNYLRTMLRAWYRQRLTPRPRVLEDDDKPVREKGGQ